MVAIRLISILLALLVVAGLAWWLVRLGRGGLACRGPRKRHVITRIICGSLGAGILVVLTVGTLVGVSRRYDAWAFPAVTAHVPALPPPKLTTAPGSDEVTGSVRLLVQLVVLDTDAGGQVVRVGETQMRWNPGRTSTAQVALAAGQTDLELTLKVSSVVLHGASDKGPEIYSQLSFHSSSPGQWGSGSTSNYLSGLYDLDVVSGLGDNVNTSLISLLPPSSDRLRAVAILTVLSDNDPLKEVSVAQLMAMHQGELSRALAEHGGREPYRVQNPMPALGLALAAHVGLASLSLLVAAILLTQLFRRRTYAFAGVLAVVILYAAAMDRGVLGMNVSHLTDASAPSVVRTTACRQTAMSFFYGKTALREIEAVASDRTATAALSQCARHTAEEMTGTTQHRAGKW